MAALYGTGYNTYYWYDMVTNIPNAYFVEVGIYKYVGSPTYTLGRATSFGAAIHYRYASLSSFCFNLDWKLMVFQVYPHAHCCHIWFGGHQFVQLLCRAAICGKNVWGKVQWKTSIRMKLNVIKIRVVVIVQKYTEFTKIFSPFHFIPLSIIIKPKLNWRLLMGMGYSVISPLSAKCFVSGAKISTTVKCQH